jgi:hypothetical protein
MTKAQLMNLVLDQLLEQMIEAPESFELLEPPASVNNSIVWRPKVTSKVNPSGPGLTDPMNTGACIIVTYCTHLETLTCNIGRSLTIAAGAPSDAHIEVRKWWIKFSSEYRKYNKLVEAIKDQVRNKDNMKFLKKLMDVLPGSLEKHILGKSDE